MALDRRLILFATSENPDPYVNAICHGVLNQGVKSVEVIVIADHAYVSPDSGKERSDYVLGRILAQLQGLSEGRYQFFGVGLSRAPEALSRLEGKELYKKVLDSINRGGVSATTIALRELFDRLRQWRATGTVIVDVTTLQKNLLVDVVSSSLLLDFAEVYSLELRKAHVTHGQEDLFHNLLPERDYAYRNLLESEPVKQASRRMRRWRLQLKAYLVLAVAVCAIPFFLAKVLPAEKVIFYVGVVSSLVTIVTAFLPFVREKFD